MFGEFVPPVLIEIKAIATEAIATFKEVDRELVHMNGVAAASGGAMATMNRAAIMASAAMKGLGVGAAAFAAYGVHAQMQVESAYARLDQALKNTGQYSKETSDKLHELFDASENLGFQNEASANAMGTLVTSMKDVGKATNLYGLAMDLARYKHIDLNDAAFMLSRAARGNARVFSQLGIIMDTSAPKSKAVADAFAQMATVLKDQAAKYAETFQGKLEVLRAKLESLAEQVGSVVIPILSGLIDWFGQNAGAILAFASALAVAFGVFKIVTGAIALGKAVMQAYAFATYASNIATGLLTYGVQGLSMAIRANPIGFFVTVIMALGAAFIYAWNNIQWFRDMMVTFFQIVVNGIGYLVGAIGTLLEAATHIPGIGGMFDGIANAVNSAALKVGEFSKGLDSLRDMKAGQLTFGLGLDTSQAKLDTKDLQKYYAEMFKGMFPEDKKKDAKASAGDVKYIPGTKAWFRHEAGSTTYVYNISTTANSNASPKLIADSTIRAIKYGKPISVGMRPKASG